VTESSAREFNAFIVGNLEVPLFNRQQGPLLEAQARRTQLEQEQAALKIRITLEVTNAYTNFKANQARLQRYETELLPYSVAVVDKSRLAFQEGKTSILTPINAQQAYMNTRLGYLQALIDFQNSISDLERAVGAGL
jgi:cobalt-zinc-cadmium efflux system outer membrane protein